MVTAAVLSFLLGLTLVDRLLGTTLARLAAVTYGFGAVLLLVVSNGFLQEGDQRMIDHLDPWYRPRRVRRA